MKEQYLFLVVCYYNEEDIEAFIRNELESQSGIEYHCVIIDNASHQSVVLDTLAGMKGVFVCRPKKNLGYFGGAAFGLEYYKELMQEALPPLVVLCNTDIYLKDKDLLNRLCKKYVQLEADVIGPDIVSCLSGQHQNPYIPERISKRKMKFFLRITSSVLWYNLFLLPYYLKLHILPFFNRNKEEAQQSSLTYSLHGSFLVFTRGFFDKRGHFSYASFLFGEEIFMGELARENGMNIVYDPSFKVYHTEHATTGIFKSAQQVQYMHASYQYILTTYYTQA